MWKEDKIYVFQNDYHSHPEDIYRSCSDHHPVSSSFSVLVFGQDLARQRRIDDYAALVRFRLQGGQGNDEGIEQL